MSAADRGTAALAGRVIRQSKDKPARWMAPRKLPNCRRIVFSEGRIAASVQLSAVGRRPRWSMNSRRAATASSSLASATSEIGTAAPSNTPGSSYCGNLGPPFCVTPYRGPDAASRRNRPPA
jgi:hypothetical protein